MRSIAEAEKYWHRLSQYHSLTDLKISVSSHKEPQITAGLRSVCWKIFLLFQSLDRSTWTAKLLEARSTYSSLRSRYLRAIEHPDEFDVSSVDPLSEHEESPWNALRADEGLRAEIFQDIERCMPDNVYFRQPATQRMMLDVLFVWCKMHPEIGYRQGMHEILAPLLWVVERDAVADVDDVVGEDSTLLATLLDARCIEQDSYTLFALIMKTAKSFYAPAPAPAETGATSSKDTPMLTRSARIFDSYLPKVDPALSAHLIRLEIVPQIFLLRWIRLLFGREFPLDSVLDMWDALFAIDPTLELVDLISVAMLLRIRWRLVAADTNEAFSLLLRYPPPDAAPAYTFIKDALYLRDNLSPEGGVEIITRYGERAPLLIPPRTPDIRSPSPALAFVSSRTRHTLASPRGFPTGQQGGGGGGGLESLLQNAARGVIDRGSQWAVGKAIRDAVGDVKRNMEAYQASGNSNMSGRSTPAARSGGGREFRKPARGGVVASAAAGVMNGGVGHDALMMTMVRKVEALEERNKSLAKMLEGAVAEMWDYHKGRTDGVGKRNEKKDDEEEEHERKEIEKLSLAIAKVQFVQVYLEDATIPLPGEEEIPNNEAKTTPAIDTRPALSEKRTASAPPAPVQSPGIDRKSGPNMNTNTRAATRPSQTPGSIETSQQDNARLSPPAAPWTSNSQPAPPSLPTRAPLASSSFSWMLGQAGDDKETDTDRNSPAVVVDAVGPRSAFAKASAHSALAADEKRRRMRKSKGFLFGEEGEGDEDGEAEGDGKGGGGGGGGGGIGIGKGVRVRTRAKRGSVSAMHIGGLGGTDEGTVEEEVIDLDDVGGSRGVILL
ncbi:RabGAP/TBC [Westerdykella ornata]|uniref:RabGAP/TBC n=1 Tax=Westerdykella ornata TaxID=318751 RepID=A0A6A6JHM5_WESOR|nr:RabGAP/TBC [Westerdykella ornata]KAF2275458.1 RabGAP/TBC [Westerdykella ornata]